MKETVWTLNFHAQIRAGSYTVVDSGTFAMKKNDSPSDKRQELEV